MYLMDHNLQQWEVPIGSNDDDEVIPVVPAGDPITCPKCGTKNKPGTDWCVRCIEPLKK